MAPSSTRTPILCTLLLLLAAPAGAQFADTAGLVAELSNRYRSVRDIPYLTASNWEATLDVHVPREATGPLPTLVYIHGGGWIGGSKEASERGLLPWFELGWAVVNVEYRLGRVAGPPAAVEDCRCALRWVIENAEQYHFDPQRLVVSGSSAGGHLALTTGLLPVGAGFDNICMDPAPGSPGPRLNEVPVAAVINWYGITDVADLIEGPNAKNYAVRWFGSLADRRELAERLSPLTYVRAGLPPILTIHGDADPVVPHTHAVRLHEALQKVGVRNELVTVPGGGHGGFTRAESITIHRAIEGFLRQHGLLAAATSSQQ